MEKNQIKVSVFVPVFNDENNIENCINSLINQKHKFDEIIIVNDCSSDGTKNILEKYDNITVINNEANKGVSFSRNIGIEKCNNEIIAGIDSDVELEKDWLKKILELFLENKAVYCCGYIEEKYTKNQYNLWRSIRYPLNWGHKNLKNPPFIFTNNTLQYKSVWLKTGGFDETFKNPGGDDIDYSEKVSKNFSDKSFYFFNPKSMHLANDNILSLSNRIWRYHSFGYKIKKPSLYRLIKLILKQFNFLIKRLLEDLIKLRFFFMFIDLMIFITFIKYEFFYTFFKKKY